LIVAGGGRSGAVIIALAIHAVRIGNGDRTRRPSRDGRSGFGTDVVWRLKSGKLWRSTFSRAMRWRVDSMSEREYANRLPNTTLVVQRGLTGGQCRQNQCAVARRMLYRRRIVVWKRLDLTKITRVGFVGNVLSANRTVEGIVFAFWRIYQSRSVENAVVICIETLVVAVSCPTTWDSGKCVCRRSRRTRYASEPIAIGSLFPVGGDEQLADPVAKTFAILAVRYCTNHGPVSVRLIWISGFMRSKNLERDCKLYLILRGMAGAFRDCGARRKGSECRCSIVLFFNGRHQRWIGFFWECLLLKDPGWMDL